MGPEGKLWVVDFGNNRVEEFTESGAFLRQFGGSASEAGHLGEPMGIYVDHDEHVWVVDRVHHRVVEFNGAGEYIGQFGSAGSGTGQFGVPEYIVGDQRGHLFVSDSGNNNLQEWSDPASSSQVSTEVTVDGRRVEATEKECEAETCSIATEWTLQSASFTPGSHEVVVRATDGLGNTTSKTLNIKTGDTAKPNLEIGGELIQAPGGWIEQAEGNYALHASATDSGFGVTSLVFSIDGETVATKTQTCPAGACSAAMSMTVNARDLYAGAHSAKVVAVDGAGNSKTKDWTINVDPEGEVSVTEAEATLEAVEETARSGPGESEPILVSGEPDDSPSVGTPDPGGLPVTETEVPTVLSQDPAKGIEYEIANEAVLLQACSASGNDPDPGSGEQAEIELETHGSTPDAGCSGEMGPEERRKLEEEQSVEEEEVAEGRKTIGREPITVTPLGIDGGASGMAAVDGAAALAVNTRTEVDSVFRPISAGGYNFEAIRSAAAPEHYGFELNLYEQELVQVDSQEVWVKYTEGGPVAFSITALSAHDATGTSVPTELAVTGSNVITLTIHHRGGSSAGENFVYPVIGGTGWEGGYRTINVELAEPPPPPEIPGEESGTVTVEGEFLRTRVAVIGPGIADSNQSTPQGLESTNPAHWFAFSECIDGEAKKKIEEIELEEGGTLIRAALVGNCARLIPMEHTWRGVSVRGWVHVNSSGWVWINEHPANQVECKKWGLVAIAMVHCYVHPRKVHGELTVGGDFRTAIGSWFPKASDCLTIYGHLRAISPHQVAQETIDTQVGEGEKCHWPAE